MEFKVNQGMVPAGLVLLNKTQLIKETTFASEGDNINCCIKQQSHSRFTPSIFFTGLTKIQEVMQDPKCTNFKKHDDTRMEWHPKIVQS